MKKLTITAITVLILLSACERESAYANLEVRPVDAWSPFVQVVPPRGIWEVQAYEPVDARLAAEAASRIHEALMERQERVIDQIYRIYEFLAPNETHLIWNFEFTFPDYFGGVAWAYDFQYLKVFIVEGKEGEAADLLAYIEDFKDTVVLFSTHSHNELRLITNQIWSSEVYPRLWFAGANPSRSAVVVSLFNYSEEEKDFFREYVFDSPLIYFECAFESRGEDALISIWIVPPALEYELDSMTISAQIQNTYDFVFSIYNDSENYYHVASSQLSAYTNGRWMPILSHFDMFHTDFEPGLNQYEMSTAHFTRQIEGPYKITFYIRTTDLFSPVMHRLTHEFSNEPQR